MSVPERRMQADAAASSRSDAGAGRRLARARPALIEIMGPAGAGKTSLVRALRDAEPGLRAGLGVPRRRWFPALLRRLTPIFVLWLVRYRRDRWFTWNEMKSIAFLDAWLSVVERPGAIRGPTVFDHGPVYRLARIREFGPMVARSDRFERWRVAALRRWLDALDVVVSLDAPDDVLLARVDRRGHWWLNADRPLADKHAFYARYRQAFETVLETAVPRSPHVLAIRSDEATPEEIARRVLSAIESDVHARTQEAPR
jgi:hypothetical protein